MCYIYLVSTHCGQVAARVEDEKKEEKTSDEIAKKFEAAAAAAVCLALFAMCSQPARVLPGTYNKYITFIIILS
jgi:hypothetical protein